jgi:hypothetical protein
MVDRSVFELRPLTSTAGSPVFFCSACPDTLCGMTLTDADLREFIEAWKQDFDEVLSVAEARQHASQLLELYSLLARPLPSVPIVPS